MPARCDACSPADAKPRRRARGAPAAPVTLPPHSLPAALLRRLAIRQPPSALLTLYPWPRAGGVGGTGGTGGGTGGTEGGRVTCLARSQAAHALRHVHAVHAAEAAPKPSQSHAGNSAIFLRQSLSSRLPSCPPACCPLSLPVTRCAPATTKCACSNSSYTSPPLPLVAGGTGGTGGGTGGTGGGTGGGWAGHNCLLVPVICRHSASQALTPQLRGRSALAGPGLCASELSDGSTCTCRARKSNFRPPATYAPPPWRCMQEGLAASAVPVVPAALEGLVAPVVGRGVVALKLRRNSLPPTPPRALPWSHRPAPHCRLPAQLLPAARACKEVHSLRHS